MNLAIAADALKQMAAILNVTSKSVDEIVAEYDNTLTANVRRGFRGQTDERELAAAHRDMIRAFAPQAYYEGLRQGGVEQDEADDDDRATIKDWIGEQLSHVRGFAEAVMDAKRDKALQDAVYARLDQWLRALQSLGNLGYASAQKNAMGIWEYGATEHCATCAQLNGKRHRLKWYLQKGYIPREPGSQTLDCGGWECQCQIIADNGRVLLPA
jgi:hypothetical protein